jgi:hypothetical protein
MRAVAKRHLYALGFVLLYWAGVLGRPFRRRMIGRQARDQRWPIESAESEAPASGPFPKVAVVYVYPIVGDSDHDALARRFAATYAKHRPLTAHRLHVVFNGGTPSAIHKAVFAGLDCGFIQHDDTGWDIGAYQRAAREIDCDMVVCLGGSSFFVSGGWLERMTAAFAEFGGRGFFGATASFERRPHIRTSAFWCRPELIRAYPRVVATPEDRYEFEHGDVSITSLARTAGLGCWLVTWDGIYAESEWRTPANIFRRGDQSNALACDRHFELYEEMDEESKAFHATLADTGRPPVQMTVQ